MWQKNHSKVCLYSGDVSDKKHLNVTEYAQSADSSLVDTFVDFYELLHVQPTAPTPVIKASYRAMMQKLNHHPDRGGDVGFSQLLNEASQTLCNEKTREQYDMLREQWLLTRQQSNNDGSKKNSPESRQSGDEAVSEFSEKPEEEDEKEERQARSGGFGTRHYQPGGTPSHEAQASADDTHFIASFKCPFCQNSYSPENSSIALTLAYTSTNRCQRCNGAKTRITAIPESSNDELRKLHRQQHQSEARVWPQWPCETPVIGTLQDFSPAGCALLYSEHLQTGAVIMIETAMFNAICRVRHARQTHTDNFLIGLEFITLATQATPGSLLNASA